MCITTGFYKRLLDYLRLMIIIGWFQLATLTQFAVEEIYKSFIQQILWPFKVATIK